jgi:DUF1009 family protein
MTSTHPVPSLSPDSPDSAGVSELAILAGKGDYPLLLAQSARQQGVKRIVAIAFRHETERAISRYCDQVHWIYLGQLQAVLDAFRSTGIKHAVMAGQITPTHLFSLRLDRAALSMLNRLRERNAHTIFGAFCDELKGIGLQLLPAHLFMESAMPPAGLIANRSPSSSEESDINLGIQVAKTTSGIEIGQTVVLKQGTILAVEAFEGTDEAILRAGRLGGPGIVVVKVAKRGHDMRFDIPVIGTRTLKTLRKVKAGVLAVEAGRTILLQREELIRQANRMNLCLTAVPTEDSEPDKAGSPGRPSP